MSAAGGHARLATVTMAGQPGSAGRTRFPKTGYRGGQVCVCVCDKTASSSYEFVDGPGPLPGQEAFQSAAEGRGGRPGDIHT